MQAQVFVLWPRRLGAPQQGLENAAHQGGSVFRGETSLPLTDYTMLTGDTFVSGSQVSRLHTWVIPQPDKHLGVQKLRRLMTKEEEKGRRTGRRGGGGGGRNDQGSLEGRRGNPHA